jgi:hypothetical protein
MLKRNEILTPKACGNYLSILQKILCFDVEQDSEEYAFLSEAKKTTMEELRGLITEKLELEAFTAAKRASTERNEFFHQGLISEAMEDGTKRRSSVIGKMGIWMKDPRDDKYIIKIEEDTDGNESKRA